MKDKMRNLFKSGLIAFISVILFTSLNAQENSLIKPLRIGDTVPDLVIEKMIRPDVSGGKLSDFKDKLLILDFWDTYCGSCIELMPKMDSLQDAFGGKVKILPVTYQRDSLVRQFFNRNKFVKKVKLSCVVEDKVLATYFPHKSISHLVWIYKGVVMAITYPEYLNAGNIQKILDGESVSWLVKTDVIDFNYNASLDENKTKNPFLRNYLRGIAPKAGISFDSVAKTNRIYFVNFSLYDIYGRSWAKINPHNFVPHPGRFVLEVKDPSKYIYDQKKDYYDVWSSVNTYCYQKVIKKPVITKVDWLAVVNDLDSLFGLRGRYEKRKVSCLVITPSKIKALSKQVTSGNKGLNMPLSGVAIFMDMIKKYPPVIDESGTTANFIVSANFNDIKQVKIQLKGYGFDLIEAEREIEQFVLTEVK